VRRRALLPAEVLRPLRSALVVTVLFNVGFGFSVAGIDNAAHFGGLAGGFLAGLALVPAMEGDRLRRPWIAYPIVALGCALVVLVVALTPL
jgi:rhomboid protease GluP